MCSYNHNNNDGWQSETLPEMFKPAEKKTQQFGMGEPDESKVSVRPSRQVSVLRCTVFFCFFWRRGEGGVSDGWKRFTFLKLLSSGSSSRVADCRLPFLHRHYKSQMLERPSE